MMLERWVLLGHSDNHQTSSLYYMSQALTSGKISQIPHELLFHSFPLCSISSHLFCPFPVLSSPFHFIIIRVSPTCLNCFKHLLSWNAGWSLYFHGAYETRRWDRDSTQGVLDDGRSWFTLTRVLTVTDERRETALNWVVGLSGDWEEGLVLRLWRLQTEGRMAWKHIFHFLGGRKFITASFCSLNSAQRNFKNLSRESSAYLLITEDFQMELFPPFDALEISISIHNCSQRCCWKNCPLWV